MHPLLRGFQHRNFRLFFLGQTLTMIGTWMQYIAISWLMYRLTGSAFMLGMTGFALQIPILLVSPFAGVWVDRYDRRTMLMVTQTLALAQALLLAALTFAGLIQVWHVLVVSLVLGTINAVANPSRNTFLLELVENKANLPNAIALNSLIMNSTRCDQAGVPAPGRGEIAPFACARTRQRASSLPPTVSATLVASTFCATSPGPFAARTNGFGTTSCANASAALRARAAAPRFLQIVDMSFVSVTSMVLSELRKKKLKASSPSALVRLWFSQLVRLTSVSCCKRCLGSSGTS